MVKKESIITQSFNKSSYLVLYVCVCVQSCQSPPDSSVHEILQARILEWVAMSSFRESTQLRDQTQVSYVSCIGKWVLYH